MVDAIPVFHGYFQRVHSAASRAIRQGLTTHRSCRRQELFLCPLVPAQFSLILPSYYRGDGKVDDLYNSIFQMKFQGGGVQKQADSDLVCVWGGIERWWLLLLSKK